MVIACAHCHKPIDIPFIEMVDMELAIRELDDNGHGELLCEDCFDNDKECMCDD